MLNTSLWPKSLLTGGSFMPILVQTLEFSGHMARRGFSLYVWEIQHPDKGKLLYVGRTGDNSSPNASSPIRRMGQHFHPVNRGNTLYRWLTSEKYSVELEFCTSFKLFSYGPLFEEIVPDGTEPEDPAEKRKVLMDRHRGPRDVVAGLEKTLADTLREAGYKVMNDVRGRIDTEFHLWHQVLEAFAGPFRRLNDVRGRYQCGPECVLQRGHARLNVGTP